MNIKSTHQGTQEGREPESASVCRDRARFDMRQDPLSESVLVSDKPALGECCSFVCSAVGRTGVSGIVCGPGAL